MFHKLQGMLFLFAFTLVISGAGVGMCYGWLRTVHSPLRIYQRKMLCYVALLMASGPILGPLCMASVYWLMPLKPSAVVAIALFLIWGVAAIKIMQRMFKPGTRLSENPE